MYVDANLLNKGIYYCDKPFIYSEDETIEGMIERAKQMKGMTGENFISDKYLDSLRQCELTEINITLNETNKEPNQETIDAIEELKNGNLEPITDIDEFMDSI